MEFLKNIRGLAGDNSGNFFGFICNNRRENEETLRKTGFASRKRNHEKALC